MGYQKLAQYSDEDIRILTTTPVSMRRATPRSSCGSMWPRWCPNWVEDSRFLTR